MSVALSSQSVEDIIRTVDSVAGWMSVSELDWLIRQAATRQRIVEVGGFCGRTTLALAMATLGTVTTVDTWRGEPQDFPDLVGDALFAAWEQTVAEYIDLGVVNHFTGTLTQYARNRRKPVDFVFIDGDHTRAGVIADCHAALRIASPGTLIAGHDWPHPGLEAAVREVFPHAECVVDRIWIAGAP